MAQKVESSSADELKDFWGSLSADEQKKVTDALNGFGATEELANTEVSKASEPGEAPEVEVTKIEAADIVEVPKEEVSKTEEAVKVEEALAVEEAPVDIEETPKEAAPVDDTEAAPVDTEKASLEDDIEKKLEDAFKVIDKDASGFIEASELKTALKALGVEMTDEEVEAFMKSADIDGNTKLDMSEYKVLCRKAM